MTSRACERQLQHLQGQYDILRKQLEKLKLQRSQETGAQVIKPTREEIAAANEEAVEAAIRQETVAMNKHLEGIIAENGTVKVGFCF